MSTERDNWLKDIVTAQTMTTNKMDGVYLCPELRSTTMRIGQDDHAEHPSRRGNVLYYRDGRTERVTP
ncbi:MAG TPA: hypothetical protein VLA24_14560 [Pseudomonadales bacterium]|nr:hypothetical protein [Pseudomonadales bacterium]